MELARRPAGALVTVKGLVVLDETVRWCFGCRAHLPHDAVLWGDEGPSYYDPVWALECSRCHQDRTTFPGY